MDQPNTIPQPTAPQSLQPATSPQLPQNPTVTTGIPPEKTRPSSGDDTVATPTLPKPNLKVLHNPPQPPAPEGQKVESVTPGKLKNIVTLLFLLGFFSLAILGAFFVKSRFLN